MTYYKKYEPIFGSWHIVKLLGEGNFGRVFEIEREDFGTTYKAALKTITVPQNESEVKSVMASGMDSASVTEYFEGVVKDTVSEFVQMSKLKGNSHVVSYEDHQVIPHADKNIGWDILIRMELLTPLLDYAQNSELTRKDVMKLGIDMCHALELCQKHNIIHRDIKPENIFVSDNGNFKLGDFGIARTIEKTSSGLSKKGTYTYMAPEVYKGEEYGSAVDIYSLGIVLYRLLNKNRTPFLPPYPEKIKHSDTDNALIRRISGEAISPPSGADGRLAEIVLKACAYNAKDRYSSPMLMRSELEAILYGVDESKVIYPQGDNVEVEPNDYAESDENDYNGFGDEGTVSIFGSAAPSPALETPQVTPQQTMPPLTSPQNQPANFCMSCGASLPVEAAFCMGCGAKRGQVAQPTTESPASMNVSQSFVTPDGSAIPLALHANEEVLVQGLGEIYTPTPNDNITFDEIYGYITLTNQRIHWTIMNINANMVPISRDSYSDYLTINISEITSLTPKQIFSGVPNLYYWAFEITVGNSMHYGFCFDNPNEHSYKLFGKRERIVDYLMQTHNISLISPFDAKIPVQLHKNEYIIVECEESAGCFKLTNQRLIWTKTNFSMTKRKPFVHNGKTYDDVSVPLKTITSIDYEQHSLFIRFTAGTAHNILLGDSTPYYFDLLGAECANIALIIINYLQNYISNAQNN